MYEKIGSENIFFIEASLENKYILAAHKGLEPE